MKKNLLLLSILFVGIFSMNAQFTVEDDQGNPIEDGDVVTFNVTTYPEASLDFFVNNTSATDDIYTKIEFVSAVNADGSMMELCYGLCYTGITIGNSYPPNNEYVEIAPGGQTGPGNHFYNSDPGNGTDIIEYVFRFYQVDQSGMNEIGDELTMTYRYDPLLGIDDVEEINLEIASTLITDKLVVETIEDLELKVIDLQGRIVKQQRLNAGHQEIAMNDLRSQIYLVQFTNVEGQTRIKKIVVR
jgi:hypothetical protein